jgi:hypothetical protein
VRFVISQEKLSHLPRAVIKKLAVHACGCPNAMGSRRGQQDRSCRARWRMLWDPGRMQNHLGHPHPASVAAAASNATLTSLARM